MKNIQNSQKKSYRNKLLLASITAFCTNMIAMSVTQASDIDIYQEAKSGQITLMFMLDISGSMGAPQLIGDNDACDIPSATSVNNNGSVNSTNGTPIYKRYYCTAKTDIYFYKSINSGSDIQYFKCGTNGETSNSKCMTSIVSLPTDSGEMTTSTSGNTVYYYKKNKTDKYYDRITRLKDGMFDLLNGNTTKGIAKLDDSKVIGLSTYSRPTGFNSAGQPTTADNTRGQVRIPARALDEKFNGITQRQILLNEIAALGARGGTPTANAYAETAAYLFGTRTGTRSLSGIIGRAQAISIGYRYYSCTDMTTTGGCNSYSENYVSVLPNYDSFQFSGGYYYLYKNNIVDSDAGDSGFPYSYDETKSNDKTLYAAPTSLQQTDDIKKCSGQGIYVLTDGEPSNNSNAKTLMQAALAAKSSTFPSCSASNTSWDCMHKFASNLLDSSKNPLGLKIKTAVVGFGSDFNSVTSFSKSKTQAENIAALGAINWSEGQDNVKKAAYWGIVGEGGWYSGNSSEDIVNSVNSFLGDLGTEIPSVTTGSPTIPKDALNPAILQDDAYYQQFQPTPEKVYGLWVGNLKKYLVGTAGKLQGRSNKNVNDSRGRLITPTYDNNGKLTSAVYDFWSYGIDNNIAIADADENTVGSKKFAAKGGTWSQLKLRSDNNVIQRNLLTNRVGTGTGASVVFNSSNNTLRIVNLDYLSDTTYKDDPNRGYLISLLGYNVDAENPSSITKNSLASSAELRQVGAAMHSLPVLVTNKGKVTYDAKTKKIGSTGREDYVLFGSTQGLLHVVDAQTGQEKFAFVPNEMIDKQKQGFTNYSSTSGGISNLYYGIDGPWTVHTEYVIDGSGSLTVGTGKGTNQKGKQLAFGGLRMGGRSYYSLDLQNITTPKLNFHINPDAAGTSTPLSYMGESWSKPTIAYVNWGGVRKLVMFVGGGYDHTGGTDGKGYENHSYDQTNKKGAGVYMFSAEGSDAGSLLWWTGANATTTTGLNPTLPIGLKDDNMKYSVVSEIRTVDRNSDDLVDHLYFGDLGGQIFRVDLDNNAKTLDAFSKAPVRLLNLHKNDGKSARFYDMPSFSIYNEKGSIFAVLSLGSGNRSQPLQNYTVGTAGVEYDAIYNIYDKDVARKDLLSATNWNTKDITALGLVTEENRYSNSTIIAPYTTNGWYYKFDNCVAGSDGTKTDCDKYKLQSEKVFGTPLAMNYRLYVSTFDSSKPGISGDCGAGVKGESLLTTFCLPFGQCKSKDFKDGGSRGIPIGIGIQNITTGNSNLADCTGSDCGSGGGSGKDDNKKVTSSSNYCASTGGRIIVSTTGNGGIGEETQMCLIPQRWYEKNSLLR